MFDRAIRFCLWSSLTAAQFSPLLGCSDFSSPSLIPAPHSFQHQLPSSVRSSAHSCLDGQPVSLPSSFRNFGVVIYSPSQLMSHSGGQHCLLPLTASIYILLQVCVQQGSLMGACIPWCLDKLPGACMSLAASGHC